MRQFSRQEMRACGRRLWLPLCLAAAPAVLMAPAHGQAAAGDGDGGQDAVVFSPPAAAGQNDSLQDLLSGQGFPLTLKLKDLNDRWRRVSVGGQLDVGNLLDMYTSLMGVAPANSYYTRGQTVAVGGETYLIAYHVTAKQTDLAAMMRGASGPPQPEKMTGETVLSLALLNLRTSGSLKDIRPFNLQQETGAAPAGPSGAAARNSASLSNLKQLGLGLVMYAQDYDEVLPPMKDAASMKKALYPYVKSEQLFISPITKEAYRPNPTLAGKKLAHITNPAAMVSIYEASPAPDGTRGVAFVDGHAKRIKEAEWPQLKKASKIP